MKLLKKLVKASLEYLYARMEIPGRLIGLKGQPKLIADKEKEKKNGSVFKREM